MSVILKNTQPPLQEVAELGSLPLRVYGILWESASMDIRYDPRKHLPWEQRRDCGGTTEWTIKGLSAHLGSCHKAVSKAMAKLMDHGFVSVAGYNKTQNGGTKHTIFRVTHPDQLANQRHAIEIMGSPADKWRAQLKGSKSAYQGEIWDLTDDPATWTDYDPNFNGLYGGKDTDFVSEVNRRLEMVRAQTPCKI